MRTVAWPLSGVKHLVRARKCSLAYRDIDNGPDPTYTPVNTWIDLICGGAVRPMPSPARRVTLTDVAACARVSRATASLVVRDSPLVAGATRLRVLGAMDQLGYVYHRGAASLRSQRTHTIGLVITDLANPFFAELTLGVEAALGEAGHVVVLGTTADRLPAQDRLLATMHEHNVDGILLCPAAGTPASILDRLAAWHLPCALLARYIPGGTADYAGMANVQGAREAVEHLLAHGHLRIAFVGGSEGSSARRDRLAGYAEALLAAGIPLDPGLMPTCPPTRAGGHAAAAALLARDAPPTAALCYNDVVAFGVMLGALAAGLAPGRDFAVVGFDDIEEAALWHPALTTLSIAPRRIGEAAARLLLARIVDPSRPPEQEILDPTLVLRASCGHHV